MIDGKRMQTEVTLMTAFQDADPMGVIYHGNYFRFFEVVRHKLLEQISYSYTAMRESGYLWPVIDVRVKYIRPVSFNHEIRITAELAEWENRLKVNYMIYDAETEERLTKGYTMQVAVNEATGEMCYASPKVFTNKVEAWHAQ
ncbi:acyl-CoA thioesterase [Verrucomicrobia bacterium]|nr:acyl-CoA thioesterase [Verrucomicrobiota bacterium]